MLQKTRLARAGDELNKGKFRRCDYTYYLCPCVGIGPENAVSQVDRRHSLAASGLGGHVCVVVGDVDGNRIF